jgi:hypothetical protein
LKLFVVERTGKMFWFAHDGGTLKSAIGKSETGWDDMGVRRTGRHARACPTTSDNQSK